MPSSKGRNKKWKKLTKKQIRDYVKSGSCCPRCSGDDIEGEHIEVDGSSCWQPVHCNNCGLDWQDVYRLESIDNVEYPEAEDGKDG